MISDDQLLAIVRGETGSQSSTEMIRAIAVELLQLRQLAAIELLDVTALRAELRLATKKWQDYEREYILPAFQWAEAAGIDLKELVSIRAGHNCVELLVMVLLEDRAALRAEVDRLRTALLARGVTP